jgi:hypothetical protein
VDSKDKAAQFLPWAVAGASHSERYNNGDRAPGWVNPRSDLDVAKRKFPIPTGVQTLDVQHVNGYLLTELYQLAKGKTI